MLSLYSKLETSRPNPYQWRDCETVWSLSVKLIIIIIILLLLFSNRIISHHQRCFVIRLFTTSTYVVALSKTLTSSAECRYMNSVVNCCKRNVFVCSYHIGQLSEVLRHLVTVIRTTSTPSGDWQTNIISGATGLGAVSCCPQTHVIPQGLCHTYTATPTVSAGPPHVWHIPCFRNFEF